MRTLGRARNAQRARKLWSKRNAQKSGQNEHRKEPGMRRERFNHRKSGKCNKRGQSEHCERCGMRSKRVNHGKIGKCKQCRQSERCEVRRDRAIYGKRETRIKTWAKRAPRRTWNVLKKERSAKNADKANAAKTVKCAEKAKNTAKLLIKKFETRFLSTKINSQKCSKCRRPKFKSIY